MRPAYLCFTWCPLGWLQSWGLELSKDSLTCLVVDDGYWLGLQLGPWPEYLYLIFPCGCLASSEDGSWIPRVRDREEARWKLHGLCDLALKSPKATFIYLFKFVLEYG